jgi:Uri superfamily endonuclease
MQTGSYDIEYSAGKGYSVVHGKLILREGFNSEDRARWHIQYLLMVEWMNGLTVADYSLKKGRDC